jgi:hypothetical protein
MRREVRGALLLVATFSLGACAALSGLDQIQEDPCAPAGCEDAAGGDDAPPYAEDVHSADVADAAWTMQDAHAPTPDTGPTADSSFGGADAPSTDSSGGGEDAPSTDSSSQDEAALPPGPPDSGAPDGPADLPEAQAPEAQAPEASAPDCGSLSDPDHCGTCETQCGTCAGARTCTAGACGGGTIYYYEAFDKGAPGWALDAPWSAAPECANPPAPDKGYADPTMDHTSATAGGVLGAYVCGNNPKGQVSPAAYATSPVVDLSAAPKAVLTFYRWLNSDEAAYMASTIDVYDGSTWRSVYQNPASPIVTDSSWTKIEYDVTPYKNAQFRVRFGYTTTSTKVYAMSAWNVDDVTLSSGSCP